MAITDLDTHVSMFQRVQSSLLSLDQSLLFLINQTTSNSFFDWFFPAITDLHKTNIFKFGFLPLLFTVFLYKWGMKILIFFSGLILALGLNDWLGSQFKHFFTRPRPFETFQQVIQRSEAGGFSFPSNHASNIFCAAMFFGIFFPKGRWFFFTFAFLVSYSRVYNGVHYPIDIIVGAILGLSIGGSTAWLMKKINNIWAKRKFERGLDD